jgi:hypothetical protein
MRPARRAADLVALVHRPHRRIRGLVQGHVEQRDVDVAALAAGRALRIAETMPRANTEPVMKSTIDSPKRTGGPSGSPVRVMKPASACIR